MLHHVTLREFPEYAAIEGYGFSIMVFLIYHTYFTFSERFFLRILVVIKLYLKSNDYLKIILWSFFILLTSLCKNALTFFFLFPGLFVLTSVTCHFLWYIIFIQWIWLIILGSLKFFSFTKFFKLKLLNYFLRSGCLHFVGNAPGDQVPPHRPTDPNSSWNLIFNGIYEGTVSFFVNSVPIFTNTKTNIEERALIKARDDFKVSMGVGLNETKINWEEKDLLNLKENYELVYVDSFEKEVKLTNTGKILYNAKVIQPPAYEAVVENIGVPKEYAYPLDAELTDLERNFPPQSPDSLRGMPEDSTQFGFNDSDNEGVEITFPRKDVEKVNFPEIERLKKPEGDPWWVKVKNWWFSSTPPGGRSDSSGGGGFDDFDKGEEPAP